MAAQRRRASLVAEPGRQALAEGLTRTVRLQAAKPPRMQTHTDWQFAQGETRQDAYEAIMRPMQAALAIWTARDPSGGGESDDDLIGGDGQRVQAKPGPLRRDGGE